MNLIIAKTTMLGLFRTCRIYSSNIQARPLLLAPITITVQRQGHLPVLMPKTTMKNTLCSAKIPERAPTLPKAKCRSILATAQNEPDCWIATRYLQVRCSVPVLRRMILQRCRIYFKVQGPLKRHPKQDLRLEKLGRSLCILAVRKKATLHTTRTTTVVATIVLPKTRQKRNMVYRSRNGQSIPARRQEKK